MTRKIPLLVRTGLRSGVSELQLPCFTAVRAEIALMSGSAFAVTHHPAKPYIIYIVPVLPMPPVLTPVASSSFVIRYLENIP